MIAVLVVLAVAFVASGLGGIAGGLLVGGKDLGAELAAWMGGFYGTMAGFGGVLVGLLLLWWGL